MDGFSDEDEHMMQSWVHVDPDSLALENSCVSDSMYLVHHDSTQSLQPGERFLAKAHALLADNLREEIHEAGTPGTLFLTNYRTLFATFMVRERAAAAAPAAPPPALARRQPASQPASQNSACMIARQIRKISLILCMQCMHAGCGALRLPVLHMS